MQNPTEASPDRAGLAARSPSPSHRARLSAVLAFCLLAPLPWVFAHFLPPHNHDAAALLQFAERWLAGERLYVDLVDVNPPLIILLSLLPATIGKATLLASTTALVLCTFAFIATAAALGFRLLAPDRRIGDDPYRLLLAPVFLYLTLVLPGIEFSQRENLMVAAALPYLLLARERIEGRPVRRRLALAVALLAAVGFAIKPHFLVVPALVEAYVLASRGPRRALRDPVPWAMAAVFAGYAAYVVAALPEYLTSVVPLVRDQYLDLGLARRSRLSVLIDSPLTPTALLFVPLAALAAFATRQTLARLLALAAFGAIVFAIVQGKGWAYQVLPAECFVIALAAVLACEALERSLHGLGPAVRNRLLVALLAGFMLAAYYTVGMARPFFPRKITFDESPAGQLLQRIERYSPAGGPVLALTPGLYPHYPAFNYAGAFQAMRFMNLWLLQSVYAACLPNGERYRDPAQMPAAERMVIDAVRQGLERAPRMVIVDRNPGIPWCGGREFDFVEYFGRDDGFARHWSDYELVEEFDRYRIFVRR